MWTALIARCLYKTRNIHYPDLCKGVACGARAGSDTLLLMSQNPQHVTCRRCRATWRFKLGM
ncbi:MAG: hypothetical protein JRE43_11220 [Deltaproteobacteria bacterium]|jgi:hypothetical protein|nr:hypothetical protein [Deltaproteobacteria bacterium]MBW2542035.1 hypothetical protein [Deltaproteobacteria bacterium]